MEPRKCRVRHGVVEFLTRSGHYHYGMIPHTLEGRVITLWMDPAAPAVAHVTAKRIPVRRFERIPGTAAEPFPRAA